MREHYRDAANSARAPHAFAQAILPMLSALQDMHVWIELPDGQQLFTHRSGYQPNFDHSAVSKKLHQKQQFGQIGFSGRTSEGLGVLVVSALPDEDDQTYRRFISSARDMFDSSAYIIDLRANRGGSERRAQEIAGLFADRKYLYGRAKVRSDTEASGYLEGRARYLQPTVGHPFNRPVICLIGPGCVSSGEGFALMLKAIDHVTLVGQPTRGASGNPSPVFLSNGVSVWFSRWVAMQPDGRTFEGKGIEPDITIEHEGIGDATFDLAVKQLVE